MDKNYNIFCIDKMNLDFETLDDFVSKKYEVYCNFTDILAFGYPFEEYTLKNIIDLANRVEIIESDLELLLLQKLMGIYIKDM